MGIGNVAIKCSLQSLGVFGLLRAVVRRRCLEQLVGT